MGEHGPARWQGTGGKRSVRATTPAPAEAVVAPPLPVEPDATDAAKALAAEHNIDLASVSGTGADGKVTKDDVQALVPAPVEEIPAEPIAETS